MQVHEHFENWDHYANKCSVCLHAVDGRIILWANDTEFKAMGYKPEEYIEVHRRLSHGRADRQ